ncbi:arginyl-tRNA synthetase [Heliomicrobium modesticaldum Ice1]|uniref:Arginine--tRNA ligase n=1 Tax=Heliobacterium modesticaldum (strain ATCC 51547 / Ice1) TaxID=498761 RepID=SYR_HELMI|nr:arginine--tRNA ligase [Heliomicrobium modesticaldum]B0TI89.1 RecName: Full=Arginine--tRNA ligase; AltName: Full=Arginyl-tRNA synthetase; Short=ArgRS [Heliomicrobium modesticaldum Ice1]ABZ83509.1 arginyl-tRNA synthetase [Heliomicrobium modesticaldum Ice1]
MNFVEAIRRRISAAVVQALEGARNAKEVNVGPIPPFALEVPREKQHGDFATNVAMLMAREARMNPRQLAEKIVARIDRGDWLKDVQVAGPGFINFTLHHAWLYPVLPAVQQADEAYGASKVGAGRRVQVEFVSANPTGLLHMGNARGAALGDTLANLLRLAGFDVQKEFYINDAGNQIENFAKSLEARYLQLLGRDVPFPEEGYHGEDIVETMRGLIAKEGDKYLALESSLRREMLVKYALREKLDAIRRTLERFGVVYDVWFSEQSLHDSGAIQQTLERLRANGYIYENEGALWFKATALGEEKDEVLVRSNGIPTYFAADIAYHKNKFDRGFDWVINIWGADHHGHVSRMKNAVKAVGYDPKKLDVILMQLVRLYKGGEIVRMSKRTGQYITLDELIEEVGKDAARFFFVMRGADAHLDFDLDLAKRQSSENPVFYVQYAHARICSILRTAQEAGYAVPQGQQVEAGLDLTVLDHPAELALIRKIADLPDEVARAATQMEPHRMARYAQDLAALFHSFYTHCRVLTDEKELRDARLLLVDDSRIVLRNVLHCMGLTAPERM